LIKTLLKLAVAALLANAAFRVGMAYVSFYRFTDAVQQATQFSSGRNDDQLESRILELATEYDVPVTPDSFSIRHEDVHTTVDGAFTKPVDIVPGYSYRWPFTWHVDAFVTKAAPSER
jgi:hypothetical protein